MKNGGPLRTQSIRYVNEDDDDDDVHDGKRPILSFGSLKNREEEEENKDLKKFIYNSEEDVYRINSLMKSRVQNSSRNLDTFQDQDEYRKIDENKNDEIKIKEEDEEEKVSGGNVIFANRINLDNKEKKLSTLYIIMICYLLFCLIELVCGYYANSITLMADAAHYFAESSCFGVYIITIYVSRKKATNSMSFGFHRGEIIGVLVRATFLLGFSFWLIYYTSLAFIHPEIVNGLMMIILGIISTFFNLIMGLVLMVVGISNGISFSEKEKNCQHQHSEDELDCHSSKKTFTSVIFNGIQSCLIILAGVFIYFRSSIKYIDPSCTLIFTFILLYEAYNQMGGVITILMEGSPLEFDVERLEKDLLSVQGVIEVHDIHVWSLSIGKLSMSCHLTTSEPQKSLIEARDLIKEKYNITHTTIQVEINKQNKKKCKGNLH